MIGRNGIAPAPIGSAWILPEEGGGRDSPSRLGSGPLTCDEYKKAEPWFVFLSLTQEYNLFHTLLRPTSVHTLQWRKNPWKFFWFYRRWWRIKANLDQQAIQPVPAEAYHLVFRCLPRCPTPIESCWSHWWQRWWAFCSPHSQPQPQPVSCIVTSSIAVCWTPSKNWTNTMLNWPGPGKRTFSSLLGISTSASVDKHPD